MAWLNMALGALVGIVLAPFESLPPAVGLSVVSLVAAIGMLLVFRASSDQTAIARVKRQIAAGLFEIRLFNDDLRAMFRAQGDILRHNLSYVGLSFKPMLWMLVPFVLVLAQLQFYYGYDGLTPGQTAVVKVKLDESAATPNAPALALTAPAGVRVETPLVWIPSEREGAWRIAADTAGDYELSISLNGRMVSKALRVSPRVGRRAPERLERGFINQLLYPAEAPIDRDVPIEGIYVGYPVREVNVLGWKTDWLVAFFVLSIVFAFALRKRFGVVI